MENEKKNRKNIEAKDVIKFGLMPEIVGRFPIIANLHPLEREHLIRILTEPKNALISQYKHMFNIEGVELEFTIDALEAIADIAIKNETGARGLRTVAEEVITHAMFEVTKNSNIKKCVMTGDVIRKLEQPKMLLKEIV